MFLGRPTGILDSTVYMVSLTLKLDQSKECKADPECRFFKGMESNEEMRLIHLNFNLPEVAQDLFARIFFARDLQVVIACAPYLNCEFGGKLAQLACALLK